MDDWKSQLRAELDLLGERAVRDDMNHGGGLGTGGEIANRSFESG
jgi:hypothetical protein